MIASLGMYDPPWLCAANDALWSAVARLLRDRGVQGMPAGLSRGRDLEDIWRSPALLLAQTCGYPLVTELRETVQLVATPRYTADGCEGARHRAAIIVRTDDAARSLADLRGRRAGVNSLTSNTGMNLFRAAIAPIASGTSFFRSVIVTESHARSIAAILSRRIDVAAIDAVTLALFRDRYPHHAGRIRILDWTASSPTPPLITSAATPEPVIAALRDALDAILARSCPSEDLAALHITGFEVLGLDDYAPLLMLEQQAVAQGYHALR